MSRLKRKIKNRRQNSVSTQFAYEILEPRKLLSGTHDDPCDDECWGNGGNGGTEPEVTLRAAIMHANAWAEQSCEQPILTVINFKGQVPLVPNDAADLPYRTIVVNSDRDLPDNNIFDCLPWTGCYYSVSAVEEIVICSPLPEIKVPMIIHGGYWRAPNPDLNPDPSVGPKPLVIRHHEGTSEIVFEGPSSIWSTPPEGEPARLANVSSAIQGVILPNIGIHIKTDYVHAAGNYVGLNRDGSVGGRVGAGVKIEGDKNYLGAEVRRFEFSQPDLIRAYNVISGVSGHGVHVVSGFDNRIGANLIGVNPQINGIFSTPADFAIANTGNGVLVDSLAQKTIINQGSYFDRTDADPCSIVLGGNPSCMLIISGNLQNGVHFVGSQKEGSEIKNARIGVNAYPSLEHGIGNSLDGIRYTNGVNQTVIENNRIGGNLQNGIRLIGSNSNGWTEKNWIHNNLIGNVNNLSQPVNRALENRHSGIMLSGTRENYIGTKRNSDGTWGGGVGNTISGNLQNGIFVSHGLAHEIRGNLIGVSKNQFIVSPNHFNGIQITGASSRLNQVGIYDTDLAGMNDPEIKYANVIAGNLRHGVAITNDAYFNFVGGNSIGIRYLTKGPNVTTFPTGNKRNGIFVDSNRNTIGTNGNLNGDEYEGNSIFSNGWSGIEIRGLNAHSNRVAGNTIGGAGLLGNGSFDSFGNVIDGHGIFLSQGANNNIIGTNADGVSDNLEKNVIKGNFGSGIKIEALPIALDSGVLGGISSEWTDVQLDRSYSDMVVIATPNYDLSIGPVVTRVRVVNQNTFQIKVQRADNSSDPVFGVTVHYIVASVGVYPGVNGGPKMEVRKVMSQTVDKAGSWVGQNVGYLSTYVNPVVVGQVMSYNDAQFSTFWARGASANLAPNSSSLYVGKHVGEDPKFKRKSEILGFIVFEGSQLASEWDGRMVRAGVGDATLKGMGDHMDRQAYNPLAGGSTSIAILSPAGMQNPNGGWGVLYGQHPVAKDRLQIVMDEDMKLDDERSTEGVGVRMAHVVFWSRTQDNVISGNDIMENHAHGIMAVHADRNWIGVAPASAFGVSNDPNYLIQGNKIYANQKYGVFIEKTQGVIVRGNLISFDGHGGYQLPGDLPFNQNLGGIFVGDRSLDIDIGATGEKSEIPDVFAGNSIFLNYGHAIHVTAQATQQGNDLYAGRNSHGISIAGNYIGVIQSVLTGSFGNQKNGILVEGWVSSMAIGLRGNSTLAESLLDPSISVVSREDQGNVIGNAGMLNGHPVGGHGIHISGPNIGDFTIRANQIGVRRNSGGDGSNIGNRENGILIDKEAKHVIIGTNLDGRHDDIEGNVVAYNGQRGIAIHWDYPCEPDSDNECKFRATRSHSILGNSTYANSKLGIDLFEKPDGNDGWGVTANDLEDIDPGANDLQNYPVLSRIEANVLVNLNSEPNQWYRIELFKNSTNGPVDTGTGESREGKILIGTFEIYTDHEGNAEFLFVPESAFDPGDKITATATQRPFQYGLGSTSEYSEPLIFAGGGGPNNPQGIQGHGDLVSALEVGLAWLNAESKDMPAWHAASARGFGTSVNLHWLAANATAELTPMRIAFAPYNESRYADSPSIYDQELTGRDEVFGGSSWSDEFEEIEDILQLT